MGNVIYVRKLGLRRYGVSIEIVSTDYHNQKFSMQFPGNKILHSAKDALRYAFMWAQEELILEHGIELDPEVENDLKGKGVVRRWLRGLWS